MLETTLFYLFSLGLVLSASGVIFLKGPVHSALSLVLAFVFSACLWLLLQAEFLALILILVYVGAVMTLFLFVVMTINLDSIKNKPGFVRYYPLGLLIMAAIAGLLIVAFQPSANLFPDKVLEHAETFSNVHALGEVLYTQYVYPFELAAILLLVAIIAAIALNPHERTLRKTQDIEKQVFIDPKKRIRILKMPVEKKP